MKLVGLMAVRNESWCLGLTLRVALLWNDAVVVLLHACTDRSRYIVEQVIRENDRGRVTVMWEGSPTWDEMRHRQEMLEAARRDGATHVSIVDADEVLSGNLIGELPNGACCIKGALESGNGMLQLPLYYMRGSLTRYHTNGIWGKRITDVAFRDDPRLAWRGDCFHSRAPQGLALNPYRPIEQGQGGVMHLWACSERRIRAKCALYKVTERLRWPAKPIADIERMYNWAIYGDPQNERWGTPETWTYAEVPDSWWAPYRQWLTHVDVDAEPWQESEIRRIVAAHPGIDAGLDLFGIA